MIHASLRIPLGVSFIRYHVDYLLFPANCSARESAGYDFSHSSQIGLNIVKGLNDVLGKMEVTGHAYGIASMIHFVLSDCDCDREVCTLAHDDIKNAIALPAMTSIKRGLQNCGVDLMGKNAFLVSATHSEKEIDNTLGAFEQALRSVREEGLI